MTNKKLIFQELAGCNQILIFFMSFAVSTQNSLSELYQLSRRVNFISSQDE